MEHRHLWVRSPRQSAILRIRAEIMRAAAEYFDDQRLHPHRSAHPHPRRLRRHLDALSRRLLRRPGLLTQSGQLYIESTALALGKVYSFGPTFRAEKSKTRRHLTEFWMIEPEVAYCDLDGLLELAENFLSHIVQSVLKNRAPELQVSLAATRRNSKPSFRRFRACATTKPQRCSTRPTKVATSSIPSNTAMTSARPTKPGSARSTTVRSWSIATRRREGLLHGA
jgi:aspartyl/asparaginyl-tRNA synthetase